MDVVDRLFETVTPVDHGTRSDVRLATTAAGERLFVKSRDRTETYWLRKEYEVIDDLSLDAVETPDRVHLATRYCEFADVPPASSDGLDAVDALVGLLDEIGSMSVDRELESTAFFRDRMRSHSSVATGHVDREALDRAASVVEAAEREHAYGVVHGDLFQHNVGFDPDTGRPSHLMDWERTGWFDPLYDAAFAEHLLRMVYAPRGGLTAGELRAAFRDRLGVDERERRLLDAYGVWPASIAYQAALVDDDRRTLPADDVVRSNFERAVDRLDA